MKTLIRALVGVLLALTTITLIGAPAYAADAPVGPVVGSALELPAIPTGALILLAFFGTYGTAVLNGALRWVREPWQKKAVSVVVSVLLAVVVIVFYYAMTGEALPAWPAFIILSIMIAAAAYTLVTKRTATAVEDAVTARTTPEV